MSSSPYNDLWEFQTSFGQPATKTPGLPDAGRRELRRNLLKEEYEEYLEGEDNGDLVEIADALIDMVYIIYGTGIEYGLPMDALFNEVHRSNMSKIGPDGQVKRREDGKILKPPSFSPPDLKSIIESHQNTSDV